MNDVQKAREALAKIAEVASSAAYTEGTISGNGDGGFEDEDIQQLNASGVQNSGETEFTIGEERQTLKIPQRAGIAAPMAPGSSLQTFFARISPDASPGWNTLTISGLPLNTRVISVWMTEWSLGNYSHAGAAFFNTVSVQLFDRGTKCRVRFHSSWNRHLPAGCMVIYGPA